MNCTAKQRRRAAWTLLVGFLLAILVSLTFCAEEVNHDGKDGSGPFIRTLAPHFVLAALLSLCSPLLLIKTPIRLKVKLSD